jgi:hypothetical protein
VHVDDADALAEEWRGARVDFVEPQDFEEGAPMFADEEGPL